MLFEVILAAEATTLSGLLMNSILMTASEVTVLFPTEVKCFSGLGLYSEVNSVLVDFGRLLKSQWPCD